MTHEYHVLLTAGDESHAYVITTSGGAYKAVMMAVRFWVIDGKRRVNEVTGLSVQQAPALVGAASPAVAGIQ